MPLIAKSRNDASSMEAFLTFINPNSSALSRPNCIVKGRPTLRSLTIRWLGLLILASGTIFDHRFSIDFVYVPTHDLHRICVHLLFHFGLRRSLGSKLVRLLHCHSLLPRLRRVPMDIHTYCAYIYWMLRSRSARADESVRKMAGSDLKVNTIVSMKEIYIYRIENIDWFYLIIVWYFWFECMCVCVCICAIIAKEFLYYIKLAKELNLFVLISTFRYPGIFLCVIFMFISLKIDNLTVIKIIYESFGIYNHIINNI